MTSDGEGVGGDGVATATHASEQRAVTVSDFARDRELTVRMAREQLAHVQAALGAAGIALWSWHRQERRFEWDGAMQTLHGRVAPKTFEGYALECVHPDDRTRVDTRLQRALDGGRFEERPYRVVRPDGSVRWILTSASVAADRNALLGAMLDVTYHREFDEQLRYSQKMEAIGTLTAGIAHNFNNILMVIMPTLDFIAPLVPEREAEFVRGAAQAARRGAELVKHLMTFAGQNWSARSLHRVDEIVSAAVAMFGDSFDPNVVLSTRCDDATATVLCDFGDIQHVLVNLLLNARDAVLQSARRSGRVTLSVRSDGCMLDPLAEHAQPRPAICIEVSDDGRGMTDGVKAKAFEPFFTTKEVGQGTGLGLATSYAIIRDHEGTLTCESVPDVGTTLTVRLPLVSSRTSEVPDQSSDPLRGLRVLLVDDNAPVRAAVAHVLAEAGLRMLEADGGNEALSVLRQHPDVDVVLLDFAMPDGPGPRFVPRIREIAPRAKVLFFTGLMGTPEMNELADGVVLKPIGGDELLKAIARVVK